VTEVAMQSPPLPSVEEHARCVLAQMPYRALRGISCEWRDGRLTLRGRLPSYYLKQMAQAAVARLPGIDQLVNSIEVVPALPGVGKA
jgi:hypothetical protein